MPTQRLCEILCEQQAAADTSATGTGKTFVASAVAAALKLATLVVAPKISETGWRNAAAHFGDTISFTGYEKLRTGRTPFGTWENPPPIGFRSERFFKCEYCQCVIDDGSPPCYCNPQGIHCVETKKKSWRYGRFHFHPAVRFVIFDEVHRCAGLDSLNADILTAAKRQGLKILMLSATLASSPLEMRAIGYALGLHSFDSFFQWASRYGCRRIPGLGFKWAIGADRQRGIMQDIRAQIIPSRGVRVSVDEIPGFPSCDITSELYDLEEGNRINALYAEMVEAITAHKEVASTDKSAEHPLTKQLRAHQEIELLMVPVAVELAKDYMAKGMSVALFVNYSRTLLELCVRLKTKCYIDGSPEGVKYRQRSIDAFQDNTARAIVANIRAGGVSVSLQDLDGEHPRVGLVFPSTSARDMIQVFGRLPREGGKSHCHYRIMLPAGTIGTRIHNRLRPKLNNIAALNDEDFLP